MCHYTILGIIIFRVLPIVISVGIAILLSIRIFKSKKLSLVWKIILFILSIIFSIIVCSFMFDLSTGHSFDNYLGNIVNIWKCPAGLIL